MKTIILYARAAVVDQNPGAHNTLHAQIEKIKAFCDARDFEIVNSYSDVAQGGTFERKQFQRMLEAIRSGTEKPDMILVTQWDRFSRNLSGALEMIKTLREMGVKVKSLQDFDSNDFEIILKHVQTKH